MSFFIWYLIYYVGLGLLVILTSLGAGIGGGQASVMALEAIKRAPATRVFIVRALIIGLALIETGAIIGVVLGILLLRQTITDESIVFMALAQSGIVLALGIAGLAVGVAGSAGIKQGFYAITRQPFFASKIINMMLLTQSILQTPVIFAFLVSLAIFARLGSIQTLAQALSMLAAGLCIGIGSLGPVLGLARFGQSALQALAFNRKIYGRLLPFSFISQAIIETPLIFALLTALLLLFLPTPDTFITYVALCAGALVMAFGTLSTGLSSGKIAGAACVQMAHNPQAIPALIRTSVLVQGLIDTSAIYALVISIMCLLLR